MTFTEYNIRDKIARTTSDNGINYLKAFRVHRELDENNNHRLQLEEARPHESAEKEKSEEKEDEEKTDDLKFVEAATLVEEDDGLEFQLLKASSLCPSPSEPGVNC